MKDEQGTMIPPSSFLIHPCFSAPPRQLWRRAHGCVRTASGSDRSKHNLSGWSHRYRCGFWHAAFPR